MIVRCSNDPCERHAQVKGAPANASVSWTCEGCTKGERPYVQREQAAGVKTRGKGK